MQTVAVYSMMLVLMAWAWPRASGPIMPALAVNFAATAAVGQFLRAAPWQDCAMILRDLAVICFIRFQCTGWRRYFVGLIGLGAVMLRTVNIKNHAEIGSWEYAATLNFAFIMQLLVAGGAGDGMGAWLDHRIGRLFPRFAGLLRNVVG